MAVIHSLQADFAIGYDRGMRGSMLFALFAVVGCSNGTSPTDMGGPDLMQPTGVALEVACTDSIDSIYGDPGTLPSPKGSIIKCAHDSDITVGDLQTLLNTDGWTSAPITSGVHTYRVSYVTERGTTPSMPGYSSALLVLPDTPRAAKLPAVVARHATRGENGACAASKIGPADDVVNGDYRRLVYGLAGYGYAVLAVDGAGFANYGAANNPPAGYTVAVDAGKSILDGVLALRTLVPSSLNDKNVVAGHSEGGHSVLAALAISDSYGVSLDAVVGYSPFWIPIRDWGLLFAVASAYNFSYAPSLSAEDLWYHYTAGEIEDGPGHGLDVFAAGKRTAVKDFMDTVCYDYPNWTKLNAMGTSVLDVYDPTFVQAVAQKAAGFDPACPTDPTQNAICTKWMQRYTNDRPHITGHAATVPIFLAWGSGDLFITPDRMQCVVDRLNGDQVNLQTLCVAPGVNHDDIVAAKADVVADWIAQQTLGGPAPAACPLNMVVDAMGKPTACTTLAPNDDNQ
jgi:pimeloyl-ACP methyl ester carboxylesterase